MFIKTYKLDFRVGFQASHELLSVYSVFVSFLSNKAAFIRLRKKLRLI